MIRLLILHQGTIEIIEHHMIHPIQTNNTTEIRTVNAIGKFPPPNSTIIEQVGFKKGALVS